LQEIWDICAEFGHKWDVHFSAEKSQISTLGGKNSENSPRDKNEFDVLMSDDITLLSGSCRGLQKMLICADGRRVYGQRARFLPHLFHRVFGVAVFFEF